MRSGLSGASAPSTSPAARERRAARYLNATHRRPLSGGIPISLRTLPPAPSPYDRRGFRRQSPHTTQLDPQTPQIAGVVTTVLPYDVAHVRVIEYVDVEGRSFFAKWFNALNAAAAAKVAGALYQLAAGNLSNVKGVGSSVLERKIDFGPGYRVYFGKDGEDLVILLGGSGKQRLSEAISAAKERWKEYRRRKP